MSKSTNKNFSRIYVRRVSISDSIIIFASIGIAYELMFEEIQRSLELNARVPGLLQIELNPGALALILGLVWLLSLRLFNSRDHRVIGADVEEFKRIFNATLFVLGLLALSALFFKLDVSRLFVSISLSLGFLALVVSRWFWRQWLRKMRVKGSLRQNAAIAGPANLVLELVKKIRRDSGTSINPTLLISAKRSESQKLMRLGIPVMEYSDDLASLVESQAIDILILAGSEYLTDRKFKSIAWALESVRVDLLVVPGLIEAAQPRVHTRALAGISFLEVESPTFTGARFILKKLFDLLVSFALIILALPILLVTAIIIKATDRGPVFFLQERHGKDGKLFKMIKFRSMRVGSEKLHDQLKSARKSNAVNSNMYKDPEDPRVTPVGRFIRRYSIDELPQLFNVLKGEMSLVGPRPPLPSEVAEYEAHVHRRLLVNPGITGIWQVSGRASLSWDETVRLDLDYVENWSFIGDLLILGKTLGAVLGKSGAY